MAAAAGPLLGGSVTEILGRRWIFFLNVPIGVVTVVVASRLANISDPEAKRLDVAGLLTFSSSLSAHAGRPARQRRRMGSAPIVSLFLGSFLLMVAFVVAERRQPWPMIDLSLFRKPSFVGVSAATLAIAA
jgi:MFS family permease